MTTASQAGLFNFQALTSLGTLAASYRLYTYSPSTTTLKTAYTDAAATIPHSYTSDGLGGSYIALDARGELPAPLYLTSGGYDLCLKTSAGATVWTRRAGGIADDLLATISDASSASNGDAMIGVKLTATGAVARTQHAKNAEVVSDADFGATGDGSTPDAPSIQSAITASPAHSLVTVSGTAGSAIVGGGSLLLAATALSKAIGASINVTKSKIVIRGPARLNISAGVTALLWNYIGSSDKSGVVFEYIDFVGGAIAADLGTNSDAMPAMFHKCQFINQTTASIKTGNNGYWVEVSKCRFSGNAKGVWHQGSSADGLNVERSVFIYNSGYDIHLENGANVARILNNDFVGNLAATPVHICIDTTAAQTGAHTIIEANKFGAESRIAGYPILITGANPLIGASIQRNLAGFDSSVVGGFIKLVGTPLKACKIKENTLDYCRTFDTASTEATNGNNGLNIIGPNAQDETLYGDVNRGGFRMLDYSEPPLTQKTNILKWSRYVNAGADFTYTNATPTYMASTDENGIANNATSVLATAANNRIRYNAVDTNNQQKKYTLALWCKLDVAGSVTFSMTRGSDAAVNAVVYVGTSWQRVVFEFEQTYLAAGSPFVFDIVIDNGRTITLGGVCCAPGFDAGDLRASNTVKEYSFGVYGTAAPGAGVYWAAGSIVKNSAPAVGSPKGWVCTVSGNPGTWVSEGNL